MTRNEIILPLLLFFCFPFFCSGQTPDLRFNKKGEFKILQLTDLHHKVGPQSQASLDQIAFFLELEKPDLVVFTGDIFLCKPAARAIEEVMSIPSGRGIPFAFVFGNHDEQQDLSHARIYDAVRAVKGSVLPPRGGAESPDYVLRIKSCDGQRDGAVLYCMDSHSSNWVPKGSKGYDWFTPSQIDWFKQTSDRMAEENGCTVPSVAFFHIPLSEYAIASSDDEAILLGTRMEKSAGPERNTGMFAAMKEKGNIMATFVGHDHDNDYAVLYQGILLAYGRRCGCSTTYNHLAPGARVIVLKEGQRSFTSWVDQIDGSICNPFVYPGSFEKDNFRNRVPSRTVAPIEIKR